MTPFIFFTLEQNRGMEQEATRYGRVVFVPKLLNSGSSFDKLETTIRTIVPVSQPEKIHRHKDPLSPARGRSSS
jgi:hypothetical protein